MAFNSSRLPLKHSPGFPAIRNFDVPFTSGAESVRNSGPLNLKAWEHAEDLSPMYPFATNFGHAVVICRFSHPTNGKLIILLERFQNADLANENADKSSPSSSAALSATTIAYDKVTTTSATGLDDRAIIQVPATLQRRIDFSAVRPTMHHALGMASLVRTRNREYSLKIALVFSSRKHSARGWYRHSAGSRRTS
ncbi:hypothetical protein B0H14DRAFT_2637514 [Mycena olivaceomarginata]|nr:hypothetical protein B0H14DRAFT_2637514 [Mycena olivaceomarginata]